MIEYIVLAGAAAIFLLVLGSLGLLVLSRVRKSQSLGLPVFRPRCERVTLMDLFEEEARKLERRRRRKKLEEMLSGLFDDPKEGS